MLVLTGLWGCGSQPAEPAAPAAAAPAAPEPSAAAPDAPVSSPPASAAAEAPEPELPANCHFRAKGFCFATQEEACAAIDCPPAQCQALESHPARVKCAK